MQSVNNVTTRISGRDSETGHIHFDWTFWFWFLSPPSYLLQDIPEKPLVFSNHKYLKTFREYLHSAVWMRRFNIKTTTFSSMNVFKRTNILTFLKKKFQTCIQQYKCKQLLLNNQSYTIVVNVIAMKQDIIRAKIQL